MQYLKIPYYDNDWELNNKEKQAFSIINRLIKKRNKAKGLHNKGFAKTYGFSGRQVKEIVSSHICFFYSFLDELDAECYMRIKKINIENAIKILSCLLTEAEIFKEEIIKQNVLLFECVTELWSRIRGKLEHILLYPRTSDKVNKINNSHEIAQNILEEAKKNEKLRLANQQDKKGSFLR